MSRPINQNSRTNPEQINLAQIAQPAGDRALGHRGSSGRNLNQSRRRRRFSRGWCWLWVGVILWANPAGLTQAQSQQLGQRMEAQLAPSHKPAQNQQRPGQIAQNQQKLDQRLGQQKLDQRQGQPLAQLTQLAPGSATPGEARPLPKSLPIPPLTYPGLTLVFGAHRFTVETGSPTAEIEPGGLFSDGATFGLGWVAEYWRVEYLRQVVRLALPGGTRFRGNAATRLALDTDQVWGHLGWRAGRWGYAGLGLGLQRRQILFTGPDPADNAMTAEYRATEAGLMAGALAELSIAPPFLLQLRWIEDLDPDIVTISGPVWAFVYVIPL